MGSEVIASRPRLPILRHSHDPVPHVSRVPLLADRVGGGEFNKRQLGVVLPGCVFTQPSTHPPSAYDYDSIILFYRVRKVVVDLGWVDIYFGCSTTCPILLGQLEVWQNGLWSWAG